MTKAYDVRRQRRHSPEFLAYAAGVGRRVAYLRHKAGMTQARVAEAGRIDLKGLQALEAGRSNPTLLMLMDVAGALGVEVSTLVRPLALHRATNPERRPGKPRRQR